MLAYILLINRSMKVLLIDDEEFLAEIMNKYFTKQQNFPIDLCMAANLEQAARAIDDTKFDLIISDLKINGLPVGDIILKLESRKPGQKYLIISAQEIPGELTSNKQIRILGYFEKPFNLDEIHQYLINFYENNLKDLPYEA